MKRSRSPAALTKKLEKGTPVIITQALGGTYTVVVEHSAGLFRVLAQDADALGKVAAVPAAPANGATPHSGGPLDEDAIWTQLKTCYDPEIPVNIVDLGLIYSMEIKPQTDGGNLIEVKMTLTAPGCGMGPSIASDAQRKILSVPGVTDAQVDVVWDPPWSADRISPEGKAKLGDDLRLAVTVLNTPSARESGRSGNKTSTSSYGNSSGFGTEFSARPT